MADKKKKPIRLNNIVPAPNQIWERIRTGVQVIIESLDGDLAYCSVMAGAKVSKLKVVIPIPRFYNLGNRGFAHVRNRTGKPLKGAAKDRYGEFNPRHEVLGAK